MSIGTMTLLCRTDVGELADKFVFKPHAKAARSSPSLVAAGTRSITPQKSGNRIKNGRYRMHQRVDARNAGNFVLSTLQTRLT
ncbi:MAG: hypothetical protein HIU92_20175 [Proteobacteria bacterium]|nr:hypothetical protein [Pseudomonadota bacterium]